MNLLLEQPKRITEEEIENNPKNWTMNFGAKNLVYSLQFNNHKIGFYLKYYENLPKGFSDIEKKKFKKFNENGKIYYSYQFGEVNKDYIPKFESDTKKVNNYHIRKPIILDSEAKLIKNKKQFEEIIENRNILFYTGAGISMEAGVDGMKDFMNKLGIEPRRRTNKFIKTLLSEPRKVENIFERFCNAVFYNEPTKAHKALAKICLKRKCQLFTENFDNLQERAGLEPLHSDYDYLKKRIKSGWFKEINFLICIGLSKDDRGLLAWYKEINPEGKIIAIDRKQPSYLSEKDYWLKGNLQKIIPDLDL